LRVTPAFGEGLGVPSLEPGDDSPVHLIGIELLFAPGFTPQIAICPHREVLLPNNECARHRAARRRNPGEAEEQTQG
jgi:hypothetical protein